MVTREQLVERAADAIRGVGDFGPFAPGDYARAEAAAVLGAVLPQVTTVAELDALALRAVVLDSAGNVWQRYRIGYGGRNADKPLRWKTFQGGYAVNSYDLVKHGPFTVVSAP